MDAGAAKGSLRLRLAGGHRGGLRLPSPQLTAVQPQLDLPLGPGGDDIPAGVEAEVSSHVAGGSHS